MESYQKFQNNVISNNNISENFEYLSLKVVEKHKTTLHSEKLLAE